MRPRSEARGLVRGGAPSARKERDVVGAEAAAALSGCVTAIARETSGDCRDDGWCGGGLSAGNISPFCVADVGM